MSAAVLAWPAVAAESGPAADKDKPRTEVIRLTSTPATTTRIDLGQPTGIGNQIINTADLLRDGQAYGTEATLCTQVSATPGAELCSGSFRLPDGEVTWQHLEPSHTTPPTDVDNAITGGTGAYSTVRGYAHITRTSIGGPGEYTLYLVR
ncbi:hypothetical protein ACTVZO_39130 [Streptomyces sp. IBSNAI002]|uniref:hypothetical protein n=1 Tax=Streptomyces sp. IBSNAI002 TaxID=3457500 RepID=UPI003FD263C6